MDESDLDRALQIAHHCEHIPADIFNRLTGITKLLICIAIVLTFGVVLFLFCFAFFHVCWPFKKSNSSSELLEKKEKSSKNVLGTISNIISETDSKNRLIKESDRFCTGKSNPPPPKFLPPQAPISPKEINNRYFPVARIDSLR